MIGRRNQLGYLSDKFHSFCIKMNNATQTERDFGPQHPDTVENYRIANEAKIEFQEMLEKVDEDVS